MTQRLVLSAILSIFASTHFISASAIAATACEAPQDIVRDALKPGPSVEYNFNEFYYYSNKYLLVNFSSFDEKSPRQRVYCFKYELENRSEGGREIKKVFWPEAEIMADRLQVGPKFRLSIRHPWKSVDHPRVQNTKIFAFKNVTLPTRAWAPTAKNSNFILIGTVGRNLYSPWTYVSGVTSGTSNRPWQIDVIREAIKNPLQIASVTSGIRVLISSENQKLLPRGSSFGSAINQVSALTFANFADGKVHINSTIGLSKEIPDSIIAPYLLALSKANKPEEIPVFLEKMKGIPVEKTLSFNDKLQQYRAHFSFEVENQNNEIRENLLFVVKQPITILTSSGGVCFLTETYSPVPISMGFEGCSLEF